MKKVINFSFKYKKEQLKLRPMPRDLNSRFKMNTFQRLLIVELIKQINFFSQFFFKVSVSILVALKKFETFFLPLSGTKCLI